MSTSDEAGPFKYYFQNIFSKAQYMPSLGSLWSVRFDSLNQVEVLKQSPNLLKKLQNWNENHSFEGTLSDILDSEDILNGSRGCVFARSVVVPGEKISTTRGPLKYGGYTAPIVTEYRAGGETVNIKFLETNYSFVDNIIRPWSIMAGYYGMITRDESSPIGNVKCGDMCVTQYMIGDGRPMVVRKEIIFVNVVPVSVGSSILTQTQTGETILETDTSFVYDSYQFRSPRSVTDS